MTINVTKTDLNRAAKFVESTFKKADTNHTGVINPDEIKSFKGPGKAALEKVYEYAKHIEGGAKGDAFVHLSTAKEAVEKLLGAAKDKADDKGNKDHKVQGKELKFQSTAGGALVRLAHMLKKD